MLLDELADAGFRVQAVRYAEMRGVLFCITWASWTRDL